MNECFTVLKCFMSQKTFLQYFFFTTECSESPFNDTVNVSSWESTIMPSYHWLFTNNCSLRFYQDQQPNLVRRFSLTTHYHGYIISGNTRKPNDTKSNFSGMDLLFNFQLKPREKLYENSSVSILTHSVQQYSCSKNLS